MISTFTIPSDGGFYTIPNTNVSIDHEPGLANPATKLGIHDYANNSGSSFQAQFYSSRKLTIGGYIVCPDVATFAQTRRDLGRALSFLNALKTFTGTTDDGLNIQFDAVASSELIIDEQPGRPTAAQWSIDLLIPDNVIYTQGTSTAVGSVTTLTGAGVPLPISFPLALSGTISGTIAVTNSGNARVFPSTITLTGPGTTFSIANKTTGDTLSYTGSLLSTETLVIDPKRKTAMINGTTNVYGLMTGTWIDLYYGNNVIALSVGSGDTSATGISISYKSAYLTV